MSKTRLFDFVAGRTPLLIDVPHAGTEVPHGLRARLTPAARLLPDTDWHVDKLYACAAELGASLMLARQSRYLVDLNRDPLNRALYAGADNTELVPRRTFANEPIYLDGTEPGAAEIAERRARDWQPYHDALAQHLAATRAVHGYAILLDAHSIRSVVPRFFDGRLPDLNLGTADGTSCTPELQRRAFEILQAAAGFSAVCNGRFKGGYITRHYGRPGQGIHALQVEIAQACYMDENPPYAWDPARAAALQAVLRSLVTALIEWRPG